LGEHLLNRLGSSNTAAPRRRTSDLVAGTVPVDLRPHTFIDATSELLMNSKFSGSESTPSDGLDHLPADETLRFLPPFRVRRVDPVGPFPAPGTYVLDCESLVGATVVHTWRPEAIEFSP